MSYELIEDDEDNTEDLEGSKVESKELMIYHEQGLNAKLRDLRALRGEIDGAIALLERALDIMGGISPCREDHGRKLLLQNLVPQVFSMSQ